MCPLMGCYVSAYGLLTRIVNQEGDSGKSNDDVGQLREVDCDTPSHIGGLRTISLIYKEYCGILLAI